MSEHSAQKFHDDLAAHRLIIPVGVPGAFGRGSVFEDVLTRLDDAILRISGDERVEHLTFPPVIARSVIEQTGYMDSFPHLCGAVHSFVGAESAAQAISLRIEAGAPWGDLLAMTDVVLNPAACYPFYPTCSGVLPATGRSVTMHAWVYRHEPSVEPTRMQSFRVREYVRAGTAPEVVAWRDVWLARGQAFVASLGLEGSTVLAADPFFGRGGKMLAAGQLGQRLKFEVLIPVIPEENPTACCSFNYHGDKFARAFNIRAVDGALAHTACLGFGLERLTMALFRTHGFNPQAWPAHVRDRLRS